MIGHRGVSATPTPTPTPTPTLDALTLSASAITENSAAGTIVGGIQNTTLGSVLSLVDSAGGRFAISGGNIVAGSTPTNYEAATSHDIMIVETLVGISGSPKSTTLTINVANVFEQPNLAALTFSATTFVTAASSSGTIIGATSGSTIAASGLPTGLTINGPARTWAWDGTGSVSSGSINLTETLTDSSNSPRVSAISWQISATPGTLQVLTLSASSIAENSATGTVVGTIQNVTSGSALSLSDTAGSRFAISGGNIVAGATLTNYESATTHNITVVETLAGATGNPKSTVIVIGVTNVFEQPNLIALVFSATTFLTGQPASGTIIGATAGSTVTAASLPSGLTINGAARTWAWDGTGSISTGSFTLTETLADSSNSPRATSVNYAIAALATPTITNVSSTGATPLVLQVSDGDYVAGYYLQWEFAGSLTPPTNGDGSYTTTTQSGVGFIDGDAWARLDLALGYSTPSGAFAFHARILEEDEAGAVTVTDQLGNTFTANAGSYSTDYTDTISVSVAQWSSSTGTNKSQYLTVSGGNLTLTMNNTVNANCGCRATISVTGKRYFETTIVSHGNQSNGSIAVGVTDATTALGAATFPSPGGSGGGGGCSFRLKNGSTAITVFRNGGNAAGTALTVALADGDKLGISIDTTANTVKLSHCPVSTGVWNDVQTLTMTSQIPAAYRAYSAGYGRTASSPPADAWSTSFGGTTFSRTLDAGYLMYG